MVDPSEPEPWIVPYVGVTRQAEVTEPDPDNPNRITATDTVTGDSVSLVWAEPLGIWQEEVGPVDGESDDG